MEQRNRFIKTDCIRMRNLSTKFCGLIYLAWTTKKTQIITDNMAYTPANISSLFGTMTIMMMAYQHFASTCGFETNKQMLQP